MGIQGHNDRAAKAAERSDGDGWKERFEALIAAAADGIVVIDGRGRIETFNPAAERLFGYTEAEVRGQNVKLLMPAPYRDEHDGYLHHYQTTRTPRIIGIGREVAARREDGSTFPIDLSVGEIMREGQSSFVGIIRDISAARAAQVALKASERQLRLFVEQTPFAVAMFDCDMRVLVSSMRWRDELHADRADPTGRSLYECMPDAPASWREKHEGCLRGELQNETEEHLLIHGKEEWLRWRAQPWHAPGDEAGGIIIFAERITARRKTEERLRQRDELLRLTLEKAPLGIATIDHQGRFQTANSALCRMLDYTADELTGMLLHDVVHPDDRPGSIRQRQALESGQIESYEVKARWIRKDGAHLVVLLHNALVHGPDARPAMMISQVEDRTQQERAAVEAREQRERLAHVGRMHTLGQMAAGIAHEVNQPLTAIATYAQACRRLAAANNLEPEELVQSLGKIAEQAERAGAIIQRVRRMVGKHETRTEELDCRELVRDVVRLSEADARIHDLRVVSELEAGLPHIVADSVHVQQVLLNLIRNALEAMNSGGIRHGAVIVRGRATAGDTVEFSVTDTGPGLDPKARDELFAPFFTTKPDGLGMGLSISHGIVTALGGEMGYRPSPGGGATFYFTLPTATAPDE